MVEGEYSLKISAPQLLWFGLLLLNQKNNAKKWIFFLEYFVKPPRLSKYAIYEAHVIVHILSVHLTSGEVLAVYPE